MARPTNNNITIWHPLIRRLALFGITWVLTGCVVVGENWQPRAEDDGVQVSLREYPGSDLPEFRAEVSLPGRVSDVMQVLTDFQAYPRWVYQCESVTMLETVGYTEAYLNQINSLPLVADPLPFVPFGEDQYRSLRFDNTTDDNDIDAFGRSMADLRTFRSFIDEI